MPSGGGVHSIGYFVQGHLEHATFREEALVTLFEGDTTEESAEESTEEPHRATAD